MSAKLTEDGAEIAIDGDYYLSVLQHLHERGEPRTYFEIGTLHGDTLKLSRCRTVAVDPAFQLRDGAAIDQARVTLRETTSDAYFAAHDPKKDLGAKIDLAFLDGMHEFAFLLRDFINTEKACARGSIIVLHDCIPLDAYMTRPHREAAVHKPSNHPDFWTGDVWKMIPVLRRYRPGLEIHCLDATPTGLAICTNLDPKNRVLSKRYDAIVREWEPVRLEDYGMARLFAEARVESASAWRDTIDLFHRPLLERLGATVQPRRRVKQLLAAVGLTA